MIISYFLCDICRSLLQATKYEVPVFNFKTIRKEGVQMTKLQLSLYKLFFAYRRQTRVLVTYGAGSYIVALRGSCLLQQTALLSDKYSIWRSSRYLDWESRNKNFNVRFPLLQVSISTNCYKRMYSAFTKEWRSFKS
jgi:hypothetical protein